MIGPGPITPTAPGPSVPGPLPGTNVNIPDPNIHTTSPIVPNLQNPSIHQFPPPAPFNPNQRSILDRIVDGIIGDGPNSRYALICESCACHNGLALKEQFENIRFVCAYCGHLNVKGNPPIPPPPNISFATHIKPHALQNKAPTLIEKAVIDNSQRPLPSILHVEEPLTNNHVPVPSGNHNHTHHHEDDNVQVDHPDSEN